MRYLRNALYFPCYPLSEMKEPKPGKKLLTFVEWKYGKKVNEKKKSKIIRTISLQPVKAEGIQFLHTSCVVSS